METREKWDASAQDYQKTFRLGQNDYNKAIFDFWLENGMLRPGYRVLDIGCGVGKYGVMFASVGCDVTLTDISPVMLAHADENLSAFDTPHRTYACDFNEATGQEDVFCGGFDFSISTMSPAVHDIETVTRMSRMTDGFCFLTRFFSWHQPDRDALLLSLGLEPKAMMSGFKEDCAELIETIKAAGYAPTEIITNYNWQDERSIDDMTDYMQRNYTDALNGTPPEKLRSVIEKLSENGVFTDRVNTEVAWIYWDARSKET